MKGCDELLEAFLIPVSHGLQKEPESTRLRLRPSGPWSPSVVDTCGSLQGPLHLPSAPRDCRMDPLGGSVSVLSSSGLRWDIGILPLRSVEISQAIVENKSF